MYVMTKLKMSIKKKLSHDTINYIVTTQSCDQVKKITHRLWRPT